MTIEELKEVEYDRAHSAYKDLPRIIATEQGAEGITVTVSPNNEKVAIVMGSFRLISQSDAQEWLKTYLTDRGIKPYRFETVDSEKHWFDVSAFVKVEG